jgi:hypothetical protein
MSIFGAKTEGSERKKLNISLTDVVLGTFLVLVVIQILGLLFNQWFNTNIYLGPGFLLFTVAASVILVFALAVKLFKKDPIERKDVVVMFVVFAITILALIYLRPLVPEIFQQAMTPLKTMIQSAIPLP